MSVNITKKHFIQNKIVVVKSHFVLYFHYRYDPTWSGICFPQWKILHFHLC